MTYVIYLALIVIAGLIGGLPAAAVVAVVMFLLWTLLALLQEVYYLTRYKREYAACVDAVRSRSEEVVDRVNSWTTHYYVHKTFRAQANAEGLEVGYRYSIRTRARGKDWGGGDGDPNVPFYFG